MPVWSINYLSFTIMIIILTTLIIIPLFATKNIKAYFESEGSTINLSRFNNLDINR